VNAADVECDTQVTHKSSQNKVVECKQWGTPPPPGTAPNVCAIQVYGVNDPPRYVRYISEFSETFCPTIEINRISDIITVR